MPIHLEWTEIAIRLLCTIAAGFLIGFDRGEHGRPAGLRTILLVSLAACLAMLQVNLLLGTAGKPGDSFVVMDLMRLPLGILSGMGFIGAGAIIHRDNLVLGVTTAATLWYTTVLGLCFGGGQIALGLIGLLIGLLVVAGLRHLESRMKQEGHSTLTVVTTSGGPTEDEIRAALQSGDYKLIGCDLVYTAAEQNREFIYRVNWRGNPHESATPAFVHTLVNREGVARVAWNA